MPAPGMAAGRRPQLSRGADPVGVDLVQASSSWPVSPRMSRTLRGPIRAERSARSGGGSTFPTGQPPRTSGGASSCPSAGRGRRRACGDARPASARRALGDHGTQPAVVRRGLQQQLAADRQSEAADPVRVDIGPPAEEVERGAQVALAIPSEEVELALAAPDRGAARRSRGGRAGGRTARCRSGPERRSPPRDCGTGRRSPRAGARACAASRARPAHRSRVSGPGGSRRARGPPEAPRGTLPAWPRGRSARGARTNDPRAGACATAGRSRRSPARHCDARDERGEVVAGEPVDGDVTGAIGDGGDQRERPGRRVRSLHAHPRADASTPTRGRSRRPRERGRDEVGRGADAGLRVGERVVEDRHHDHGHRELGT